MLIRHCAHFTIFNENNFAATSNKYIKTHHCKVLLFEKNNIKKNFAPKSSNYDIRAVLRNCDVLI